jgi:hypothetical protein
MLMQEIRIDSVQYMPMVAGIRKRMRNTGEVMSAYAEVVYENDEFWQSKGTSVELHHKPTPLGKPKGAMIGAYAVIKLANGEILIDVLDAEDIEKARGKSRARDALMWKDFTGEAWRKTALRRCSKQAPQSSELQVLASEEEAPDEELPHNGPSFDGEAVRVEPNLIDVPVDEDKPAEVYEVVDAEGTVHEFKTPQGAIDAMAEVFRAAAKVGAQRLSGVVESNEQLASYLNSGGHAEAVGGLLALVTQLGQDLRQKAEAAQAALKAAGAQKPVSLLSALEEPSSRPAASEGPAEASQAEHAEPAGIQGGPALDPWYEQASLEIEPQLRNGRPDWTHWMEHGFGPRMKGALTTHAMGMLMADNEKHVAAYKAFLGPRVASAFDQAVKAQWERIGDR